MPVVLIRFGVATSPLPTLHCFPANGFTSCVGPLEPEPVTIVTSQKDKVEESRGRCLHTKGGREQACDTPARDWLEASSKPRPLTVSWLTSFLLQNPWLLLLLSLSVSLCVLSHCWGCWGPCVELVLPLSKGCYKRGDHCHSMTSERLHRRMDWHEDELTGSYKWMETFLKLWSDRRKVIEKEDETKGHRDSREFQLTRLLKRANVFSTDDASNAFLGWRAELAAASQQIWSIIHWQFVVNEGGTEGTYDNGQIVTNPDCVPAGGCKACWDSRSGHWLAAQRTVPVTSKIPATNWLSQSMLGLFRWPKMLQLHMLGHWTIHSCLSEQWGWTGEARPEVRGLSRQTTTSWTGTMRSVLMVRRKSATVLCSDL